MNIQLLRTLIALQSVPAPDPQPESLEPKPPWEAARVRLPEPAVVEIGEGAARRLRELVEAPEPIIVDDPIDIRERAEALRKAAGEYIGEPYAPTFHAPPRGRVVSQAKGPNRAADRARGIYGKRGKK